MSTTSQDDWRAEALKSMETADQQPVGEHHRQDNWLPVLAAKFALWALLSGGLVFIAGWGSIAASAIAAWFLFWPR